MSWNPAAPNVTDYYNFLLSLGVPAQDMPSLSTIITNSQGGAVLDSSGAEIGNSKAWDWVNNTLALALQMVNYQLQAIGQAWYNIAVYNFAADRFYNFAQDLPGQNYLTTYRENNFINNFTQGIISSASDSSTSQSFATPQQMTQMTLMDLQMTKTIPGRTYLQLAEQAGTLWGLS